MGMFLSRMTGLPMADPVAALYTDAMTAACGSTVFPTTIFTKTAIITDRSAFAAHFSALGTDIRTILAGTAVSADYTAFAAVVAAIRTDVRTVFAGTAVVTEHTALAAIVTAIRADLRAVFTGMAVFTVLTDIIKAFFA